MAVLHNNRRLLLDRYDSWAVFPSPSCLAECSVVDDLLRAYLHPSPGKFRM